MSALQVGPPSPRLRFHWVTAAASPASLGVAQCSGAGGDAVEVGFGAGRDDDPVARALGAPFLAEGLHEPAQDGTSSSRSFRVIRTSRWLAERLICRLPWSGAAETVVTRPLFFKSTLCSTRVAGVDGDELEGVCPPPLSAANGISAQARAERICGDAAVRPC